MNDFDQAVRYAVRHLHPFGFFRWMLGDTFVANWKFEDWLDTQAVPFPREPDRRCDTVAAFTRIASDAPPLAFVFEYMSQTRRFTLRRLLQYSLQIQDDCPFQEVEPRVEYAVLGSILNLTGIEQEETLVIGAPDTGELGLHATFCVRGLATESAEGTLAQIEAGSQSWMVLVFVVLMKGADTAEFVRRWRAAVEKVSDPSVRLDIVGLSLVLSELVDRRPLRSPLLEGMDVERSVTVMEWEAKGERRGQVKTVRSNLLMLLRSRFGKELPEAVTQTIANQQDFDRLTAWFEEILGTQDSLDTLSNRFGWTS